MNSKNRASGFHELFQGIEKNASADKPLVVADSVLTYGLAIDRIKRLSKLYQDMGLRQGDRMIIATRNDIDLVVFFLSLLRCGIAAAVVDPETKPVRLKALLKKSEAKAIAVDSDLRKDWLLDNEAIRIIEIKKASEGKNILLKKLLQPKPAEKNDNAYPLLLDNVMPLNDVPSIDKELDAYILFTSGTISEPKGVVISHKNLFAHLATLSNQFGYDSDSRILNILPLDHTDGLVQGPVVAFYNGATVYRPLKFSIQNIGRLLDSVYTHRITHFVAVPTILSLIQKLAKGYEDSFTTSDFRFIISAAAYLEPDLWENFEKRFKTKIANVYGLTETVTGGLFSGPTDKDHKIGTVGKPVDCEARVVDENGADVPSGEPGEIILRGDNIMKGYCNAPEDTANVLKNGWLYTGDLGFCGEDGFYRIAGRKKSIIKSGGMNINPNEITEVINMHPDVLESATIGFPDELWGEIVVACVVSKPGSTLIEADLIKFIRNHLETYKIPARVCSFLSLPRGPSGKVKTEELKRSVEQTMLSTGDTEKSDLESSILQTAAKCFHTEIHALSFEKGPSDLTGWDSLAHMEFVTELEERFNIKFSTPEIMRIEHLRDAKEIVFSKLKA